MDLDLQDLIGKTVAFFGISESHTKSEEEKEKRSGFFVHEEAFLVKLDSNTFQINRYEPDDYRSMCGEIKTVDLASYQKLEFFPFPLARVRVERIEEHNGLEAKGYRLVDVNNGHIWLVFGTVYYDEWYPYFYHNYEPKPQY